MRFVAPILFVLAAITGSWPAFAQSGTEFSIYGATSLPSSSEVQIGDTTGPTLSFDADWSIGPAAGLRVTWWQNDAFGFGLDFNNTGAVATTESLIGTGINELGFDDGLSFLTINAYHRWNDQIGRAAPYVGAGVGVAMPQFRFGDGTRSIYQRQITGPAMQVVAGASMPLTSTLSVFGEYQGSFSHNSANIGSGQRLDTNILGSGVNVGISFGF